MFVPNLKGSSWFSAILYPRHLQQHKHLREYSRHWKSDFHGFRLVRLRSSRVELVGSQNSTTCAQLYFELFWKGGISKKYQRQVACVSPHSPPFRMVLLWETGCRHNEFGIPGHCPPLSRVRTPNENSTQKNNVGRQTAVSSTKRLFANPLSNMRFFWTTGIIYRVSISRQRSYWNSESEVIFVWSSVHTTN